MLTQHNAYPKITVTAAIIKIIQTNLQCGHPLINTANGHILKSQTVESLIILLH